MYKVYKGKRKSRNLFEKSLVHFMSISLLFQLFGLNFTNKLVYADGTEDKLKNTKVSLLNGKDETVSELNLNDSIKIKYNFVIPKGTELTENTEYTFEFPDEFNTVSEGDTVFNAVTTKIEKLEAPLNTLANQQEKVADNPENKDIQEGSAEEITDNKEQQEKNVNENNDEDIPNEKNDDNKNTDESNQSENSTTEVKTELDVNKEVKAENNEVKTEDKKENNIEPKNETNNEASNSETKERLNNNESNEVQEKSQQTSGVIKLEQNTEVKVNPASLEKEKTEEVSLDFINSMNIDIKEKDGKKFNRIIIKSKALSAEEDIKCEFTVNTTVSKENVSIDEFNKTNELKFYINNKVMSYNLSFKGKEIPASDFITGAYISDKSFSSDINEESCPMNPGFEEYIKNHKIENFDPTLNSLYTCYKFRVPEDISIDKGDGFTLKLPDEIAKIAPTKEFDCDLKTDKNIKIGRIYFKSDNTIKVVFNEEVSENSKVEGYFWFGRKIEEKIIENKEEVNIVYKIGEESFEFTVNLKHEDKKPSITKSGKYVRSENAINWEVKINPGNSSDIFKNYTVYDELKEPKLNSFITDSLVVDDIPMPDKTDCFDGSKFKYTFEEIKKNEEHCIKFKTQPTQKIVDSIGETYTINNAAILKDNNEDTASELCKATAKVDILNDYIKKTGKYDANGKQVIWNISINNSNMELKDVVVEDKINTDIFKMPEIADITAKDGTVSISGSTIFISYPEIKEKKTITIKTKLKDNVYTESFGAEKIVDNKAKIYIEQKFVQESVSPSVKIGTIGEMIKKSLVSGQGNKVTDLIVWKVNVNLSKIKIKNARLYESLSDNQEFKSADVYKAEDFGKPDKSPVKTINSLSIDGDNKSYIDLGFLDDEYVIIVTTKLKDSVLKEFRNKNGLVSNLVKNTSTLKGEGLKLDGYSATAFKSINTTVLEKKGSYNKDDRTIEWTIIVNSSHNPITNAVLTDIIPEGQEYVVDTFSIEDKQQGDSKKDSNLPSSTVKYTEAEAGNPSKGGTLTYEFGSDVREDSYIIKYKTKISGDKKYNENSSFKAKNTAKLNADEFSKPVIKEAEVEVKNFLIQKKCAYNDGDDFITWEVYVNQNNIMLNNMTIIDELPEGLKLDSDTLEFYKVKLDSNGNITGDKEPVPQSDYSVDYDISTGKITISYPKPTNDSFLLKFETPVLINQTKYTNKVSIESNEIKSVTTQESKFVRFDEYGVGARGEKGTINIVKVDKNDETHKLPGAKFQLIRKSDNKIMDYTDSESTTDDDGKVTFKKVKYGDYIVREIKAPEGYETAVDQEVTISSENETVNLKFTDEFIVVKDIDISLIKAFSDNKTGVNVNEGSGAEFTLYTDPECTTSSAVSLNKEALWDGSKYIVIFKVNYLAKNTKYYLKETKAPNGYSLNSTIYCCNIDVDGNVTYAEINEDGTMSDYTSEIPVCLNNKEDNGGGSSSGGHHHHHNNSDDDDDDNSNKQPDETNPENPSDNPSINNGQTNPNTNIPIINPGNNNPNGSTISNSQSNTDKPNKSEKTSQSKSRLPQAGSMIDTKVLVVLGAILVVLGVGIEIRKKHTN